MEAKREESVWRRTRRIQRLRRWGLRADFERRKRYSRLEKCLIESTGKYKRSPVRKVEIRIMIRKWQKHSQKGKIIDY
jgi:hypothetical protein